MQNSSEAEDEYILWNSQIRELLVMFILGSILYGIAFSIIKYFRRPTTPGEEDRNTISFVLSSACLAVAIGSMLLVPTTIVCHDVLLLFPNNYYLQWLSRHLVYTLWNRIFWASNVCLFVLLPMAYFYHEASGFGQSFKGFMWRISESFIVWSLFTAALGGFVFLARLLYTSSQVTPDYSPFAYSLMSLVGSLFILWYTPGGIVVLGKTSIDLFRTYKVLLPANRQELLFESEALKFKLQKIQTQKRSMGAQPQEDALSGNWRPRDSLTTSRPQSPTYTPISAIWTKSLLLPTLEPGQTSSEKRNQVQSPSQAFQHAVSLQQQMIQASKKSSYAEGPMSSPPSPSEFVFSPKRDFQYSEPHSSQNLALPINGYSHFERESNHQSEASVIDGHEVVSKEQLENAPCTRTWPRVEVDDQISTLRRMVQQTSERLAGASQTVRRGLGMAPILNHSPISAMSGLSGGDHRWSSLDWDDKIALNHDRGKQTSNFEFAPKMEFWAQEVDWREADVEHASAVRRLNQVEQELAKYATEPERTTLVSSVRWLVRNILAIVLSTINLILPLLLFVRPIAVHLRPYFLATERAGYYYSFLAPEETSSTAWFTSEIVLITYLTLAAFTGLFTSGFMAPFKPHKRQTGVRRIIVAIYLCLVLAAALPVVGRILGLISFDLMGAYDNMGYLKSQILTYSMQTLFASLLVKRYLEFFPWTNYVTQFFINLFDWANRPWRAS